MGLPPEDALRWIVRGYARLRAAHGEAIGIPVLVHPTAAFFPDAFHGDAPSVERLLRRIMAYAPIADDLRVELALLVEGEQASGCGSVACGSSTGTGARVRGVEDLDDGYRVFVAASDVGHPDLLTASLARGIGGVVLCEAQDEYAVDGDAKTAELAAVVCGFGVLLANGAAVWAKSCGGLRMGCGTALSVEETAMALALFVTLHGIGHSEARADLRVTQREALDLALAWTESNPLLLEAMRDRPHVLEAGGFDFEPVRGIFGRWLRKRQIDKEMIAKSAKSAAARPAPTDAQKRRLEEARALVDEVIGKAASFQPSLREGPPLRR
jgi:hypothetical protein